MPDNEDKMNELVLADSAAEWRRAEVLVRDRSLHGFSIDIVRAVKEQRYAVFNHWCGDCRLVVHGVRPGTNFTECGSRISSCPK
jgi:hypothetical protein